MRVESRSFADGGKCLVLIPEFEREIKAIGAVLGKQLDAPCVGEVRLSDGYGQEYICLRPPQAPPPAQERDTDQWICLNSGARLDVPKGARVGVLPQ